MRRRAAGSPRPRAAHATASRSAPRRTPARTITRTTHYARHPRAHARRRALAGEVARRALDIFDRIAERRGEAARHHRRRGRASTRSAPIDSIVDIVGAAAALAWLAPGVGDVAPRRRSGDGTVDTRARRPAGAGAGRARAPRAAPRRRWPTAIARELTTPTGAAHPRRGGHRVDAPTPADARPRRRLGRRRPRARRSRRTCCASSPVEPRHRPAPATTRSLCVEANIDDMSPELCAPLARRAVRRRRASTSGGRRSSMKKGRPGAAARPRWRPAPARDAVVAAHPARDDHHRRALLGVERRVLARELVEVATRYGPIPVKVAARRRRTVNAAPEYEACRACRRPHGVPVKAVYAAAWRASLPTLDYARRSNRRQTSREHGARVLSPVVGGCRHRGVGSTDADRDAVAALAERGARRARRQSMHRRRADRGAVADRDHRRGGPVARDGGARRPGASPPCRSWRSCRRCRRGPRTEALAAGATDVVTAPLVAGGDGVPPAATCCGGARATRAGRRIAGPDA